MNVLCCQPQFPGRPAGAAGRGAVEGVSEQQLVLGHLGPASVRRLPQP